MAAADNDVLKPTDDLQATLFVQSAKIAGQKPAITVEGSFCCRLVVEIAKHQTGTLSPYLTNLANRHLFIGIVLTEEFHLVAGAAAATCLGNRLRVVIWKRVLMR